MQTNTTISVTENQFPHAERAVIRTVTRLQQRVSDGQLDELPSLPTLEGVILSMPTNEEVIEMMLSQLEADAGRKTSAAHGQQPALALARKIRVVMGFKGMV